MRWQWRKVVPVVAATLAVSLAGAGPLQAGTAALGSTLTREVRRQLERLPYYGVFDLITFKVDKKGAVTLGGYVLHGFLRDDAQQAVQKVVGVTGVDNKVELLPASVSDDDLRWNLYRAIYRDDFLSRYGSAADRLVATRPGYRAWGWGYQTWPAFGSPVWGGPPFYGMEPVGEYAIHIIVADGHATLYGVVDSPADQRVAGVRANEVFGALSVANDLQVKPESAHS